MLLVYERKHQQKIWSHKSNENSFDIFFLLSLKKVGKRFLFRVRIRKSGVTVGIYFGIFIISRRRAAVNSNGGKCDFIQGCTDKSLPNTRKKWCYVKSHSKYFLGNLKNTQSCNWSCTKVAKVEIRNLNLPGNKRRDKGVFSSVLSLGVKIRSYFTKRRLHKNAFCSIF